MKGVMQLWAKIKTHRKTVGAVIQCVSRRCAIKNTTSVLVIIAHSLPLIYGQIVQIC